MTYELAKKLKDAGYDQNVPDCFECVEYVGEDNKIVGYFSTEFDCEMHADKFARIPTLSELIETCDKFGMLEVNSSTKIWTAIEWDDEHNTLGREGKGSTPEEAVANLWLELNKK